jgi:signal transduction histidine kinase
MTTSGLTQVMVNLVMNAAQSLVVRGGRVDLTVKPEAAGVRILVSDTGTGMTPEVLARVREPFFTTKPPGVGTGLGLYNTQRLINDAAGELAITSVPDQGTTVSIWLPPAP